MAQHIHHVSSIARVAWVELYRFRHPLQKKHERRVVRPHLFQFGPFIKSSYCCSSSSLRYSSLTTGTIRPRLGVLRWDWDWKWRVLKRRQDPQHAAAQIKNVGCAVRRLQCACVVKAYEFHAKLVVG